MFPDEPTALQDAIQWHMMLRDFYEMNLLRAVVRDDPRLLNSHQMELACHTARLRQLQGSIERRENASHPAGAARAPMFAFAR